MTIAFVYRNFPSLGGVERVIVMSVTMVEEKKRAIPRQPILHMEQKQERVCWLMTVKNY